MYKKEMGNGYVLELNTEYYDEGYDYKDVFDGLLTLQQMYGNTEEHIPALEDFLIGSEDRINKILSVTRYDGAHYKLRRYLENERYQIAIIELVNEFAKSLTSTLNPKSLTPTLNQGENMNTSEFTDAWSVFTQSITHGVKVGTAHEARSLLLNLIYKTFGGKESLPTWINFIPERVQAVIVSGVLFLLASVFWKNMPFAEQVTYTCKLCWESDGQAVIAPIGKRLSDALQELGPKLPSPPTDD